MVATRSKLGRLLIPVLAAGAFIVVGSMTHWFGFTADAPAGNGTAGNTAGISPQPDKAGAEPNQDAEVFTDGHVSHGGVSPAPHPTNIVLRDVTADTGITFDHVDGSSGAHYLVEAVASGLATFDYDLDGDTDIYFLNGSEIKGVSYPSPPKNRLYRNDGGWKFTDVTDQSGLGDLGFGLGVAAGDFDNDGWPDVYINNFGANALYHNNGDGSFSILTGQPTIACGNKVGGGVSMLDIEGDGNLDIYVANYIKFDYNEPPPIYFNGQISYGGPTHYGTEQDDLLRNNGDGTFTNISVVAGIAELDPEANPAFSEWGMSTIALDADQDGDTDIFVANDSTMNFLWENDGTGKFTEVGLVSGTAYDNRGEVQGSMGVDAADHNGDGWLDLIQTAYENQLATLYENEGSLMFQDVTRRVGAGAGTGHLVNWGTAFCDLDNDRDQDLFLANGHIHDNQGDTNKSLQYKMRNQVYEKLENGRYEDVSEACGLSVIESSRGAVVDDLDSDGRLDVVILNSRQRPTILRNETPGEAKWIEIKLVGTTCNRSAVGCQVQVGIEGETQLLEVHSGHGYQSHFGTILHFGVGDTESIDGIIVNWVGETPETFHNVQLNKRTLLRQGQGVKVDDPLENKRH